MKSIYYGILFVAAVMTLAFAAGCSKETAPAVHQEQILVDMENPGTYSFSDLRDKHMGWITIRNGELKKGDRYQVSIEENTVEIQGSQPFIKAQYFKGVLDLDPMPLPINPDNSVQKENPAENGVFRFTYE